MKHAMMRTKNCEAHEIGLEAHTFEAHELEAHTFEAHGLEAHYTRETHELWLEVHTFYVPLNLQINASYLSLISPRWQLPLRVAHDWHVHELPRVPGCLCVHPRYRYAVVRYV